MEVLQQETLVVSLRHFTMVVPLCDHWCSASPQYLLGQKLCLGAAYGV